MPRKVNLWASDNPDAMPPPRVRLRVFTAYNGICGLTGRQISPQDRWCLDHRVALCNGGTNEESNLWPVLEEAHKAKTATDVAEKAAVAATAKRHLGIKGAPSSLTKTPEQKEATREAKKAASKPSLFPRALFVDAEPLEMQARLPAPTPVLSLPAPEKKKARAA